MFFPLLSICIVFFVFCMLHGVNSAFQQGVNNVNFNRLIVASRISLTEPLPISQKQQIEAVPGITGVASSSWFGAYYQEQKNFVFAMPVDIDDYLTVVPEIKTVPEQVETPKRPRPGKIGRGSGRKKVCT